jgi:PleD family two-component response regulator
VIEPAIPSGERERIRVPRALNILDTPAEKRFDRLIRRILGVAAAGPGRDAEPAALVTAADRALYEAKKSGRNTGRS